MLVVIIINISTIVQSRFDTSVCSYTYIYIHVCYCWLSFRNFEEIYKRVLNVDYVVWNSEKVTVVFACKCAFANRDGHITSPTRMVVID